MTRPDLPPVVPGRSALPAFLGLETWAREQLQDARDAAQKRLGDARLEAQTIRSEGEQKLRDVVIEGEKQALREVESAGTDAVSDARLAVNRWVEGAESRMDELLVLAMALLCGEPLSRTTGSRTTGSRTTGSRTTGSGTTGEEEVAAE